MKQYSYIFFFCIVLTVSCEEHAGHKDKQDSMSRMQGMPSMPGMNPVHENHSDMLQLSAREQLLAGIQIDTVGMKDFEQSVTVLGQVVTDETTTSTISAKVKGRVDKLFLRNPGDEIHKGQALYDLYSETLLAEERELLLLLQNSQAQNLIDAARNKLQLHGLTNTQIAGIEKSKVATASITFYSNAEGYLSRLPVREGQYVETGDALFEIASLDIVRVNAQVYPGEIAGFEAAAVYEVETGGSGENYPASRIGDNPSLEPNSKIQFVRLRVVNAGHVLHPGMMTTVKAISSTEKKITIPRNAIIIENGMSFAWTMEKDGMFSRRMIQTGEENENELEVLSGLKEGEHIVTSGIYLLNSEYILRKGANSMGGMKM